MEWVWRLLFLLAAVQSFLAEVLLIQSGSELRQPGQSVKISCKASGYAFTTYAMNWVKQEPGKPLKFMGYIATDTGTPNYADDFKGRFVFSLDTSVSTAYLQINSLENEDAAIYYCTRGDGSLTNYFHYWGQGTMVTVSSDSFKDPQVFLLISECEFSKKNQSVSLACLVIGNHPLEISWDSTAMYKTKRTFPLVKNDKDYMMSSQLSLWTSELNSTHTCRITNNSKLAIEKTFQLPRKWIAQSSQKTTLPPPVEVTKATNTRRDTVEAPSYPSVNFLATSTYPEMSSWLMCEVSGFFPQDINLIWLRFQSKIDTSYFATAQPTREPGGNTFQIWSVLRIPVTLNSSLDTYTCVVEHVASRTKLNASKRLDISGLPESRLTLKDRMP